MSKGYTLTIKFCKFSPKRNKYGANNQDGPPKDKEMKVFKRS